MQIVLSLSIVSTLVLKSQIYGSEELGLNDWILRHYTVLLFQSKWLSRSIEEALCWHRWKDMLQWAKECARSVKFCICDKGGPEATLLSGEENLSCHSNQGSQEAISSSSFTLWSKLVEILKETDLMIRAQIDFGCPRVAMCCHVWWRDARPYW